MIAWVFGIPLFALILLAKNKQAILFSEKVNISEDEAKASLEVKTRYGFLFNGYRANTYYWEVVILFRKVFLVISTVFLSTVSPET